MEPTGLEPVVETVPAASHEATAPIVCDSQAAMLPTQGLIDCTRCFVSRELEQTDGHWRICNDPGAWGSPTPRILVLGFSKGFTQAHAIHARPFGQVAFAGMRPRLKDLLVRLNLLDADRSIDSLFSARETEFAFGSLVRCSLSRLDPKSGQWTSTGPLIKMAFTEEPAVDYISTCMHAFLSRLPDRLRLVILLGNDDCYIRGVKAALKRLHPHTFVDLNDVACRADGHVWVHVAHPSGLNGHFTTWLHGRGDSTAGRKRDLALRALETMGN